jgi:hypothetical protein
VLAQRSEHREGGFRSNLRTDSQAPELLLSPHFDDAVLSCWSLLASDRRLTVVNLFAGIPAAGQPGGPWEALIGVQDSAERKRARMAEDARSLARAGRAPVNLALLDAQHRGRADSSPSAREIDRALTSEVQSASRVYVPAGIGSHADACGNACHTLRGPAVLHISRLAFVGRWPRGGAKPRCGRILAVLPRSGSRDAAAALS